jgi:hypothetical protein
MLAFGDSLLGQLHSALAKTPHGRVMLVSGAERVGQEGDRDPEFIVRPGKILRLEGEPAALESALALENRRLASRHLALGDVAHILGGGPAGGNDNQEEEKEEGKPTS